MELSYSTIALLFPAIPLMFLVYANISGTIGRRLGEIFEKVSSDQLPSEQYTRLREEAAYLTRCLSLVRSAQLLNGLAMLLNVMTIVCVYLSNQGVAQLLFGCAVTIMLLSIITYLVEVTITVRAVRVLWGKIQTSQE